MLTAEDKMREGDGLLLTHPSQGLGYQVAGAFQRLGARMVGLLPSEREQLLLRHVPMQHAFGKLPQLRAEHSIHSVIVSPEPHLGRNQALNPQELSELKELLGHLQQQRPKAAFYLALPRAQQERDVVQLRSGLARSFVLLCPSLFAFRDHNLLDAVLRALREDTSLLERPSPAQGPFAYGGDAAALLLAAVQQNLAQGQSVELPACGHSLDEFRQAARAAFARDIEERPSAWLARAAEKLAAQLSGAPSLAQSVTLGTEAPAWKSLNSAAELFPTTLSSLPRALQSCAQAQRRAGGMDLLFPPGRGPTT